MSRTMTNNLAGIIPIAGHASDIDLPWHHVLMPFEKNKTLLQHAVYNCAMAGCNTIWVICDDEQQPLIRTLIGEKVEDPVYRYRAHARHASDHKRWIPIFYCSTTIRDQQRRNNIGWTAIFGCLLARKIFGSLSKHTAPDRFFVCWPYCKLDSLVLRSHRRDIQKMSLLFSDSSRSILSDDFLPVVCDLESIERSRQHCYDLQMAMSNYREFSDLGLSSIFSALGPLEVRELNFGYKKMSSWQEYCNFFK